MNCIELQSDIQLKIWPHLFTFISPLLLHKNICHFTVTPHSCHCSLAEHTFENNCFQGWRRRTRLKFQREPLINIFCFVFGFFVVVVFLKEKSTSYPYCKLMRFSNWDPDFDKSWLMQLSPYIYNNKEALDFSVAIQHSQMTSTYNLNPALPSQQNMEKITKETFNWQLE